MKSELLLALVSKIVEEKLEALPQASRGPRGLRGPRGEDGVPGKSFVWEEHEEQIRSWSKEYALKFSDLTEDQINALRGPRGERGRDGRDGSDFSFEENAERINAIIREELVALSPQLKLKFEDLSAEEIAQLRGPRGLAGKDGRPGKDFEFEEHRAFFESLKPKFSDFTAEEREQLVLRFSHLTDEEKSSLKLKFEDLTEEEKFSLRGTRGQRGKPGRQGEQGEKGERGEIGPRGVRGLPGAVGAMGPRGIDGRNGEDGRDAPHITDIEVDQSGTEAKLIFHFSDGSVIESNSFDVPLSQTIFMSPGVSGGSGDGGNGEPGKSAYEIWLEAGNTGTEADFLQSLTGPQGPQGEQGLPGLQGPAGPSSDGDSGVLHIVACDPSVYVGAAIVIRKVNEVEAVMSEWPNLRGLMTMSYLSYYDRLAQLAVANSLANSNVAGIVESKPTDTSCIVRIGGVSGDNYFGLDVDEEYYLSDETPGAIVPSTMKPTNPGSVVVKIGQPLDQFKLIYSRGERKVL